MGQGKQIGFTRTNHIYFGRNFFPVNAEILCIGDELLIGQTLNTNAQWLGEQLNLIGVRVMRTTVVGDEREEILAALSEAGARAQLILITGGLGPTKDDITKKVLCEFFETDLVMNDETLKRITSFFVQRNLPMLDVNRDQALMPRQCKVIQNMRGTANGMWFEKNNVVFISMPGVPYETEGMMLDEIIGRIVSHFHPPAIVHRTIQTQGVGESFLAEKIKDWENSLAVGNIRLAYLPYPGGVKLRLSCYQGEPKEMEEKVEKRKAELLELIGEHVYGKEKDSLPSVLLDLSVSKKVTVAVAESCTGGRIAQEITSVAGSSQYFKGGMIAYSPSMKIMELGVDEKMVSEAIYSTSCAEQMATGIRGRLSTDFALATTGVAGPEPDAAYPELKPGFISIAVAGPLGVVSGSFQFGTHRGRNIQMATSSALFMLYKEILKQTG